jgi:photosystem II stability/assembly factor-like uncharacterized protein
MSQLTFGRSNDELTERLRSAAGAAEEIAVSNLATVPTNTLRDALDRHGIPSRPRRQRVVVTTGFVAAVCALVALLLLTVPGGRSIAPTKPAHHTTAPLPLGIAYVDPSASVQFLNDTIGYLFTDPGGVGPSQVVKTSDGGVHWQKVFQENGALIGLDFVNADAGWILGEQTLFATIDGGRNWKTLGEPRGGFQFVDFATPSEGWGITSGGTLMATTDAGSEWTPLPTPAHVLAACLSSPTSGWVVLNGNGTLEGTTDFGRTWSRQYVLSPGPIVGVQLRCTSNSAVAAALTEHRGRSSSYDVATDSGQPTDADWISVPRKNVNSVGFITGISIEGTTIAVMSDCDSQCGEVPAYLAISTEGGSSPRFVEFDKPTNIDSADVSFADPENGWVVIGTDAKPYKDDIIVTSDGGVHWRLESVVPQFP